MSISYFDIYIDIYIYVIDACILDIYRYDLDIALIYIQTLH